MTTSTWRIRATATAAMAAVVAPVAGTPVSGSAPPDDGYDEALTELVDAAQEEGRVVFYSSPVEGVAQAIAQGFEQEYGIEVEFFRAVTADLVQRFSAEADAGAVEADALLLADCTFVGDAAERGWVVPIEDAGIPILDTGRFPEEYLRPEQSTLIAQVIPYLIAYNTQLVDTPPTDWPDLLEPEYEDLILISEPTSDSMVRFWTAVLDALGEEYLRDLAAQNIRLVPSGAPGTASLGAGEGAIHVPSTGGLLVGAEGAPIEGVLPSVTIGTEICASVPTEASNPNAARLFINWVLSEEGQEIFNASPFDTGPWPSDPDYIEGYTSARTPTDEDRELIQETMGVG